MSYLLDTDTCVHWLRGDVRVRAQIAQAGAEALAVSAMTLAELRYGAEYSTQPAANHRSIDDFVTALQVIAVDGEVASEFGVIKAALRKAGLQLEDADLLVAATARAHRLTLVTNNVEHFARVQGLDVRNWLQ